ncbi:Hypothetical protein CGB_M0220W [Cryptococcus gattii WM276]|uniref:Uncharacterized protein n=1 Tax=Cryptococcus gattii serotype B (strain WM276 / ATCC MYA-4071) TaxID=367775 RepID=E6REZ7_CRYGW|nr:Hypothetical protein CGB_M0220W [Cryptococcus gattii WM276]ADV25399.1 Hypothetical protein CGB_M0220W [Cryptococcus gattii WM276]KJD99971.1 hypothetical protein I311_06435 [Cryptococcus gattii NT-10]
MAACTYCQWKNATIPSEDDWSSGCSSYTSAGLGFAEAVEKIPTWAYRAPSSDKGAWDPSVSSVTAAANTGSWTTTFSRSFAEASNTTTGNLFVTTGRASGSGSGINDGSISASNTGFTASSFTPTYKSNFSSTSYPNSVGDSNDSSPSHSIPLGPVIGGVAGGLIGLILLFVIWRWYVNSRHLLPNPYSPFSTSSGFGGGIKNEKQKKKRRIAYPYPAKTRSSLVASVFGSGGEAEGDEERAGSGDKGRGRSFLDMLVGGKRDGSDNWERPRNTALYSDPTTFAGPRKAPEPYSASRMEWQTTNERSGLKGDFSDSESAWSLSNDGDEKNGRTKKDGKWKEAFIPSIARAAEAKKKGDRNSEKMSTYTTTSQRQSLARRTLTPSEMEDEGTPFPLSARPESVLTLVPSTNMQLLSTATHLRPKIPNSNPIPNTKRNTRQLLPLPPKQPPPAHLPPPAPDEAQPSLSPLGSRVDFSQPPSIRGERISENPTLPSLYEPPTGARTYRASRGSEIFSPGSRYMGTIYGHGGDGNSARGAEEGRRFSEGTMGTALGSARSLKMRDGRGNGERAPTLPLSKRR